MGNTETANRTARRRITIRYEKIPDNASREEHWKLCSALAQVGLHAHDYEKFGTPTNNDFEPKLETIEHPVIQIGEHELVGCRWSHTSYGEFQSFLEDAGVESFLVKQTTEKMQIQTTAGGKGCKMWVKWSDIGDESFEDGYTHTVRIENPENGETDICTIRFGGNTIGAQYNIDIMGPHWCLDMDFIEDAVSFISHRLNTVLVEHGYADPIFDCQIELNYSKKQACDVSWLARSMAAGARQEGEEEE